ncbi:hypothetical protein [uncultured Anaerofustis sp.]|uniref:hypothetical protein n=1 Tax=uncultured Anaerofustis sp. TaxID=904996 RepID=UPI0025DBA48A|nr:hypothetical protein [uncultured Anaerofustis sp.]
MARKNQRSIEAGKKYGKLTPIEKVIITDPYRKTLWKCECECGNTILKSGQYLLNSKNPNCGCVPSYPIPDDVLAMAGKTYGELTVLYVKKEEKKRPMAVCECSCGKIFETKAYTLKNGRTKSCGHENLKNLEKGYKIQEIARVSNTNITSIIDRKKNKNNSTGYKGVSTLESGKFRAYIYFQRKQYHLGSFENLEDAVKARKKAEENLYGNFLNWYAETYPEEWEIFNKNKIEMKKSSNKRTERHRREN